MSQPAIGLGRRSFLGAGGALAVAPLLGNARANAASQSATGAPATPAGASGRRKLGALEVSAIGIGVQNMSRTFHTTVPSRPEMHNIIRTAFERGVTFFDTAEARTNPSASSARPWAPSATGS